MPYRHAGLSSAFEGFFGRDAEGAPVRESCAMSVASLPREAAVDLIRVPEPRKDCRGAKGRSCERLTPVS